MRRTISEYDGRPNAVVQVPEIIRKRRGWGNQGTVRRVREEATRDEGLIVEVGILEPWEGMEYPR